MSELDLRDSVKVVVSNKFIKAHMDTDMSADSHKLLRMAISQCRMNDKDFGTYKISGSELAKALGVSKANIYNHIKTWSKACMKCLMVEEIEQGKKNDFVMYHIFDTCTYKDGILTMKLHPEMKPYVLEIQKRLGFTQYELAKILPMKGKYSIRLYELMVSEMKNKKVYGNKVATIELSVEEIRKQTLTQNKFKQIGELKKNVLAIAEREIEENIGIKLKRSDIKLGRFIVGFRYEIRYRYHSDEKEWSEEQLKRFRKAELCRKKGEGTLTPEEDDEYQSLILELDQMSISDFI